MSAPLLIAHLEKHLGPISRGVQVEGPPDRPKLQIVVFEDGPFANTTCYSTLGLSHHRLHSGASGKVIRMELIMLLRNGDQPSAAPSILATIAEEALASHRALLCGEVIGPRGPLWDGTRLEALYVSSPAYLPDGFGGTALEDGDRCVIAWLIPITPTESAYVRAHGHSAFEDLLVAADPDLLALDRDDVAGTQRSETSR